MGVRQRVLAVCVFGLGVVQGGFRRAELQLPARHLAFKLIERPRETLDLLLPGQHPGVVRGAGRDPRPAGPDPDPGGGHHRLAGLEFSSELHRFGKGVHGVNAAEQIRRRGAAADLGRKQGQTEAVAGAGAGIAT